MHKDTTIALSSTLLAVVAPGGWSTIADYAMRLFFAVLTAAVSALVSNAITRRKTK